mmetsp:Transcript_20987/g.53133  ORF Transcript_20987/g.53133 Transcript_20987/m.53133 type:complete len:335 (-) Transcript_20987:541-1545(-)
MHRTALPATGDAWRAPTLQKRGVGSPIQAMGGGHVAAACRVKLRVPAAELADQLVLLHKQRLGVERLVVPDHDVALHLHGLAAQHELPDEGGDLPLGPHLVRHFLHQRGNGGEALDERAAAQRALPVQEHQGRPHLVGLHAKVQAADDAPKQLHVVREIKDADVAVLALSRLPVGAPHVLDDAVDGGARLAARVPEVGTASDERGVHPRQVRHVSRVLGHLLDVRVDVVHRLAAALPGPVLDAGVLFGAPQGLSPLGIEPHQNKPVALHAVPLPRLRKVWHGACRVGNVRAFAAVAVKLPPVERASNSLTAHLAADCKVCAQVGAVCVKHMHLA